MLSHICLVLVLVHLPPFNRSRCSPCDFSSFLASLLAWIIPLLAAIKLLHSKTCFLLILKETKLRCSFRRSSFPIQRNYSDKLKICPCPESLWVHRKYSERSPNVVFSNTPQSQQTRIIPVAQLAEASPCSYSKDFRQTSSLFVSYKYP